MVEVEFFSGLKRFVIFFLTERKNEIKLQGVTS